LSVNPDRGGAAGWGMAKKEAMVRGWSNYFGERLSRAFTIRVRVSHFQLSMVSYAIPMFVDGIVKKVQFVDSLEQMQIR
jgi:hypothetical protein